MMPRAVAIICCMLCAAGTVQAGDLVSLIREYNQAVGKVGGAPNGRANRVKKHVVPVLEKIAALDTDSSLSWLAGEIDKKRVLPEVRAAIPAAMAKSSSDKTTRLLLRGFSRRPAVVRSGTLLAFKKAKTSFGLEETKLLLSELGGSSTKSEDREVLLDAVNLIRLTKDPGTREWLGDKAWSSAGSDPGRLFVLARLANELVLESAQKHLAKLVGHRSSLVSSAAIEALGKIGVGESADAIAKAITRGRGDLTMRIKALDALAAAGGEGIEVVIESAKSRDPELRAVAMGSLALVKGNRRATETLFEGLDDKDPNVRLVALRAVGAIRAKPVIGALIDVFESQKDRSFKVKVLETLVNLSGQNFGPVVEDWKKWWGVAQANFEFPKDDEKGLTAVRQRDLSYFGIEVSSKRLGFLVDISSSMREVVPVRQGALDGDGEGQGGTGRTRITPGRKKGGGKKVKNGKAMKIEVLKKELARLLTKLPADTYVNILTFDATFRAWQKALQPIRGKGRAKAIGYVRSINTGSGTNVFDTLEAALKDKRVDTIYLLTDGKPTRGRITNPGKILEEIKLQNRVRGITIHCIAFGEESDLLEKLAGQNNGQYRFVDRY